MTDHDKVAPQSWVCAYRLLKRRFDEAAQTALKNGVTSFGAELGNLRPSWIKKILEVVNAKDPTDGCFRKCVERPDHDYPRRSILRIEFGLVA